MNRNQFDEAIKKLDKAHVTKEVLQLLLAGYTNAEIAKHRGRAEGTIRKQVSNLYEKFGIEYQSPGDTNSQREELQALFKKYKPGWSSETVIAKPRRKSMDGIDASTSELSPEQVVLDQFQLSHSLPDQEKNTSDSSYLVGANSFLEYFSKSVDQLSSKDIHVRIGAISNLGTLAKYSQPAEHWTIMEYLTAFIRTNAPVLSEEQGEEKRAPELHEDIQAALTVIGQRNSKKDPPNQRLDLSNTDIRKAELPRAKLQKIILSGAKLQGVNLCEATLEEADLSRTNMEGAMLCKANLTRANLHEANLQEANFSEVILTESIIRAVILRQTTLYQANLQRADLRFAKLQGAYLDKANLQRADLRSANLQGAYLDKANLQETNFSEAILDDANLQKANFSEAKLQRARLFRADLRGATNLEQQQIEQAFGYHTTILPDEV